MPQRPLCSLSGRLDFERVFRHGVKSSLRYLVIYTRPNGLSVNRLGLAVSRKIGKAVVRNRIRRIVREAMRLCSPDISAKRDFVVVARKSSAGTGFEELCGEIRSFLAALNEKTADSVHNSL